MEQKFICDFCDKEMSKPCPDCGLDEYDWVKCPNNHIFHSDCICKWALYESYCVKCEEELIDIKCDNPIHKGKKKSLF